MKQTVMDGTYHKNFVQICRNIKWNYRRSVKGLASLAHSVESDGAFKVNIRNILKPKYRGARGQKSVHFSMFPQNWIRKISKAGNHINSMGNSLSDNYFFFLCQFLCFFSLVSLASLSFHSVCSSSIVLVVYRVVRCVTAVNFVK